MPPPGWDGGSSARQPVMRYMRPRPSTFSDTTSSSELLLQGTVERAANGMGLPAEGRRDLLDRGAVPDLQHGDEFRLLGVGPRGPHAVGSLRRLRGVGPCLGLFHGCGPVGHRGAFGASGGAGPRPDCLCPACGRLCGFGATTFESFSDPESFVGGGSCLQRQGTNAIVMSPDGVFPAGGRFFEKPFRQKAGENLLCRIPFQAGGNRESAAILPRACGSENDELGIGKLRHGDVSVREDDADVRVLRPKDPCRAAFRHPSGGAATSQML